MSAKLLTDLQQSSDFEQMIPTRDIISTMSSHGETASLESIPAEVRSIIFNYILPTQRLDLCMWLDKRVPRTSYVQQNNMEEKPVEERRWHLELLRVNRFCNAYGTQMIHHCTVSLKIDRTAFEPWNCPGDVLDDFKLAESEGLSWNLGPMMPGLQYCLLRDFELVIEPINVPGYWYCLQSLLRRLCEDHLENGGPLKMIGITFMDMVRNVADPSFLGIGFLPGTGNSAISARFEDYETSLRIFAKVIKASKQCNIHLPYWMARHRQVEGLMKLYVDEMGANVSFTPISTWTKTPSESIVLHNSWVPTAVLRADSATSRGWLDGQGPRYRFPCLADLEQDPVEF